MDIKIVEKEIHIFYITLKYPKVNYAILIDDNSKKLFSFNEYNLCIFLTIVYSKGDQLQSTLNNSQSLIST